ncbi:hypothetical protein B0H19DRAFT_1066398 [Mycena capillaripes]|nr:hypothetical protein B0H19DRAFT_1066398 [Mycena capillaripes]
MSDYHSGGRASRPALGLAIPDRYPLLELMPYQHTETANAKSEESSEPNAVTTHIGISDRPTNFVTTSLNGDLPNFELCRHRDSQSGSMCPLIICSASEGLDRSELRQAMGPSSTLQLLFGVRIAVTEGQWAGISGGKVQRMPESEREVRFAKKCIMTPGTPERFGANGNVSAPKSSILHYWGHNTSRPTLRRMARDYLTIQGSATPTEHALLSGSLTDTKLRNSLSNILFGAIQLLETKHIDALMAELDTDFGYSTDDEAEDGDL